MRTWTVWLVILAVTAPRVARSEQPLEPRPPEIIIDAKPPGTVDRDLTTGVALPPQGPARDAFLAQSFSVDLMRNEVSVAREPLAAAEFYRRVGRPDLAAHAEDRGRQRVWLMTGGGLVLAAGVVAGVLVMSGAPDTSSPACQNWDPHAYNDCADRASKAQMGGALLIGAGLVLGGVLIVWGMNVPEMVTAPEETLRLATEHNRTLAGKNGATGVRFELVPAVSPRFAGLSARLTF